MAEEKNEKKSSILGTILAGIVLGSIAGISAAFGVKTYEVTSKKLGVKGSSGGGVVPLRKVQ